METKKGKDQRAAKMKGVHLEGEEVRIVTGGEVDLDHIINIIMVIGRQGPIVKSNQIIIKKNKTSRKDSQKIEINMIIKINN